MISRLVSAARLGMQDTPSRTGFVLQTFYRSKYGYNTFLLDDLKEVIDRDHEGCVMLINVLLNCGRAKDLLAVTDQAPRHENTKGSGELR